MKSQSARACQRPRAHNTAVSWKTLEYVGISWTDVGRVHRIPAYSRVFQHIPTYSRLKNILAMRSNQKGVRGTRQAPARLGPDYVHVCASPCSFVQVRAHPCTSGHIKNSR